MDITFTTLSVFLQAEPEERHHRQETNKCGEVTILTLSLNSGRNKIVFSSVTWPGSGYIDFLDTYLNGYIKFHFPSVL